MRIVVTGGAGYVGSVLVPLLLERGHAVRVFDEMLYGWGGITVLGGNSCLEIVPGTLEAFPAGVVDGADVVIHLAGYSNDPTSEFSPERTLEVNVEGTATILRACERAKVARFVLASSASLYDRADACAEVLDEESEIDPQSTYSRSKMVCERLLAGSDIPVPVVLRKGTVFGWSPRMRWDLVANTMVRDALLQRKVGIVGGGKEWRPLLHVADAADAYLFMAEANAGAVRGQVFNVLERNYRMRELADMVAGRVSGATIVDRVPAGKVRDYRMSGAKLDGLGWKAARSASDGIGEMLWKADALPRRALFDPHAENITWLRIVAEVSALLGGGVRP